MNTDSIRDAGLHESTWGNAVICAAEDGHFTDAEKDAARQWHTNPCALTKAGAMMQTSGPEDLELRLAGMAFAECVADDMIEDAMQVLVAIEARASWLAAHPPPAPWSPHRK